MISIILVGRNDDYGGGFRERLFHATNHNASRLAAAGVDFEFVLGEWNPLEQKPLLAEEFIQQVPRSRAVVIPSAIHDKYNLNPAMPFHEMAAKNVALRRARGEVVLTLNADILLGDDAVKRIAEGRLQSDRLYRAHRIDVDGTLGWEEMQDPGYQLLSGEGKLAPCWYLGAGGDFCLATKSLWHSLRGFNERVRFSTRAKDWQFYLSAAARGVGIEFIGDVFHLDHAAGFRNTGRAEAYESTAHFGGPWDIEFGLPAINPVDWGLYGLPENSHGSDPRIKVLDPQAYRIPAVRDRDDRMLADWLTRPPRDCLLAIATLYHGICAAHIQRCRLVCRLQNPHLLVALSGFQSVAARHGMSIFCNWQWPEIDGFNLDCFEPEPPTLRSDDWIAQETNSGMIVLQNGSGEEVGVLPHRLPVGDPPFNPIMTRRLLLACLRLQGSGARKIGIYGAGTHTEDLLRWGLPDLFEVAAILVSTPELQSFRGIPVVSPLEARNLNLDSILLSSGSFEQEMLEQARLSGLTRLVPFYGDWPAEMGPWQSADSATGDSSWRVPDKMGEHS